MSPLWTKRFSVAPSLKAGIAIGRNQICAVVLDANGDSHEVRTIHTQDMPIPLFSAQPSMVAETGLAKMLHEISDGFRDEFASVHVALPDTVIRSAVLELDELPKKTDMREALLRWRFSKEWLRPEDSLDCCGFDLGEDRGKRLFFGQAMDRPWVDCIRRALAQTGIMPWSLNAAATYRFNYFHDAIVGGGSALLSLDPDCWNLLLWDDAGRIRQVLTRLRENLATEDEAASIAHEVERAISAYLRVDDSRRVDRFYLAGSETDMATLAGIFDARLRKQVVVLHADNGIPRTVAGTRDGLAPLALATALNT